MGKIVAIGGGSLVSGQTLPIDREIVRLTGRRRPRALFLPTAQSDRLDTWHAFRKIYGRRLGCRVDLLTLIRRPPARAEIARKILSAHLIYVGGGNTLKMMRRWRHLGVDRLMLQAHRRGVVLSGISAGCICWFDHGNSDSMEFYHPHDWDYIRVRGLGLIRATGCPHYDAEHRDRTFEPMIARHGGVGIAIDNNCALEVVDGRYRIITSRASAGATRLIRRRGRVEARPIPRRTAYAPIGELLDRGRPGR